MKRFLPNIRRWATDLSGNRPSIAPKIVRRPTPFVVLHRCSTRRRQFQTFDPTAIPSNEYLRVTCTWNGPTPGHAIRCGTSPGIRRAISETSGKKFLMCKLGKLLRGTYRYRGILGSRVRGLWESIFVSGLGPRWVFHF